VPLQIESILFLIELLIGIRLSEPVLMAIYAAFQELIEIFVHHKKEKLKLKRGRRIIFRNPRII